MKTILLPTDFSISAHQAADFALSLAQILEAKLVFLNVIQPIADAYAIPMSSSQLYEAAEEAAEISMQRFKENTWKRFTGSFEHFPEIETKVVYGNVASTVLDVAEDLKVDFIVMGTIGMSNLTEKIFGSNSLRVAKNAKCPVWVIPQKTRIHTIGTILYVTDLEGNEVAFIQKTINIAQMLGAKMKALHIHGDFEPEIFSSKEIIKQIKESTGDKSIIFENLHRENVVEGIENYLKNQRPDALIIAHEKKGWLERLFHKSILSQLTLHVQIPVLILQK